MKFTDYLKGAVWDFLLTAVLSMALCYQLLNCFYVDPAVQYSIVPAVVAILACLALECISFTSRTRRKGGIIYAIAVLLLLIVCVCVSETAPLLDKEGNTFILGMVLLLTPTAVFLLGRTRTGTALLFVVCAFMVPAVQYFYMKGELAWALLTVFCSVALIVYRNYQVSARTATSVRGFSFFPGFLTACASVGAAVVLGVAVWFIIIAPLNPPAVEIKLITEYRALETKPVLGVSSEYQTPNLDLSSSSVSDDSRGTDQLREEPDGILVPANGSATSDTQSEGQSASFMGLDKESIEEVFSLINYETVTAALVILCLVIVGLIAVYFVDRRVYRAQRVKKFAQFGPTKQAEFIYLFIVDKLGILGMGVAEGQTPLEYAKAIKSSVERFDSDSGVKFSELAGLYTTITYGKREIGDDDLDLFVQYYNNFWKSARKYLGNAKYFIKAFRLG